MVPEMGTKVFPTPVCNMFFLEQLSFRRIDISAATWGLNCSKDFYPNSRPSLRPILKCDMQLLQSLEYEVREKLHNANIKRLTKPPQGFESLSLPKYGYPIFGCRIAISGSVIRRTET